MNTIKLDRVFPEFFPVKRADNQLSDIWELSGIEFRKGDRILIKGGSGSGKTSLLNFICGFRSDFSGSIYYDDRELASFTQKERDDILQNHLGILFQDMGLFPKLTSLENVMIKAGLTGHMSREEAVSLLGRVGLSTKTDTPVGVLSIGQQQRVAFVRMLSQKADFWIMDEPVSHIDDTNAAIMSEVLAEEMARSGAGLISSSVGRDFPFTYDKTLLL